MICAFTGDPYSLNYWTNPVHKTGVEASAEFDGHDLFVKILAPIIYSLMSRIRRSLCGDCERVLTNMASGGTQT